MPALKELFGRLLNKPSDDEQAFARLRERGLAPHCVFDVGAAYGDWSKGIARVFPEAGFHLFEPAYAEVDDYHRRIDAAIAASGGKFHLHTCALGAEPGREKFYIQRANPVGNTLLTRTHNLDKWDPVDVEVATIDALVGSGKAPAPEILKIDVQGGELNVLKGATKTLPKIQVLLMELWFHRGYGKENPLFYEVLDFLRPHGFHLIDLAGYLRRPDGRVVHLDAIVAHEDSPAAKGYRF